MNTNIKARPAIALTAVESSQIAAIGHDCTLSVHGKRNRLAATRRFGLVGPCALPRRLLGLRGPRGRLRSRQRLARQRQQQRRLSLHPTRLGL